MSRLLITLCTYNECENLPKLIPDIHAVAPDADVLVIDDNSPDGTGRLADELAAQDSRIKVLHRAGKLGLGTATVAAMTGGIARGKTAPEAFAAAKQYAAFAAVPGLGHGHAPSITSSHRGMNPIG